MNSSSEVISQLFKASGHKARIEIISSLEEDNKSAKDLARILDTSQAYVYKHLRILSEEGLIKRVEEGFALSASGKIFVNSFGTIEVITRYRHIWENHKIDGIPTDLLIEIGVIRNAELISPAHEVLSRFIEMVERAKDVILIAVHQPPRIMYPTIHERVKEGVKRHLLLRFLPPDLSEFLPLWIKGDGDAELRVGSEKEIHMGAFIVDNNEAGIIFADSQGFLDWNFGLCGTEPEFVSWVEKNFWEMYGKAEIYVSEKN
ncbi:MAG: ArsR family transcriptional regulator [Halobacteriota archaeon]|nr:ArsR family transcriptional regulator [Halobacteriota archaeon]